MKPKKLPRTGVSITKRDCFVTLIHSQTGQATSEGTLAAGSLARNIFTESTSEGRVTTFEASTDKGEHWYRTETFEPVKDLFETARPFTIMRNRASTVIGHY
jgi:hypothetical protein